MKQYPIIAVFTAFLLTSCNTQPPGQPAGIMSFPVTSIPARNITGYTSYPVSIEGTINSAVRAKVSGYITEVLVDEGQLVQRGQVLFKLETQALTQDAEAARANVNVAQVEVEKMKPLVEKGIISPIQLKTAEARLAQAKANHSSITANIGYATIKSPVNGYVGAIPYREGALVAPNDPKPLTTVSQINSVYAFFSMNELDYFNLLKTTEGKSLSEKIKHLPPVELELVNGDIYGHKGKIETITGQVNPTTGTVSFRATFPNPNHLLVNGNSGRLRLPRYYQQATLVPETSTYEQQGKVYVFKVKGDTITVATAVNVVDRINSVILVDSGVKPGDQIVAQGIGKVRDNMRIQSQPVPFDSIANTLNIVF